MNFINQNKEKIFLVIILSIAIFFRLWQLNNIPPWLFPDVAMNGNNALESLTTGDFKLFYPDNNGREGLMMWLIGLSFFIFGISIWSIKIVAAFFGILTVFGLYFLTKELFQNTNFGEHKAKAIALLASFFIAISFWHVNFSRIGFRAILLPFVLVYSFYFLFKGFKDKKIFNFVLSGLFFGLGFYTYTSFRMAVFILPFIFIPYWFICQKEGIKKIFLNSLFHFLIIVFILVFPLGFYFLFHSQDFLQRAVPISIFAKENIFQEFLKSLVLHLGMFNFYGDPNWRHNFAGSPMLSLPLGILFLIGFIYSLLISIKIIFLKKNFFFEFKFIYLVIIVWWFLMLLPGILTYEGIPHALRTIGVIPPVFIFSGLGGIIIYDFLKKNIENKKILIFFCFFFLFVLTFFEYNKYFNLWANNQKVHESFGKRYAQIGHLLNSFPEDFKKYVIIDTPNNPVYGISIDGQTPIFIESTKYGSPRAIYLRFDQITKMIDFYHRKSIIIPLYEDNIFSYLSNEFVWGEIKEKDGIRYFDISY